MLQSLVHLAVAELGVVIRPVLGALHGHSPDSRRLAALRQIVLLKAQ